MRKVDGTDVSSMSPGIWSTDEYIRKWAQSKGLTGKCVVALQSLHDDWEAIIDFSQTGAPVSRISR